ncbi:hypothetical protein Rhal01_02712 [Rubritalea halochordaticola]|uniref:Uncharacterized protein n=1 Tax=Rubritalea halochordaticola TaxID=714537 RepID=A0ABP9V1Y5_9BACT
MASVAAFKKFKRKGVMVYLPRKAKDRYDYISPVTYRALESPEAGNTYPFAVACSPNQYEVFGIYSNKVLSDESALRKAAGGLKEKMEAHNPDAQPKGEIFMRLKDSSNYYKGTFKKATDKAIIVTIGGKERSYPLNALTKGCGDFANSLKSSSGSEESTDTQEGSDKELAVEDWASAKGDKTISGKFVSLVGDKLTIEKSDGKTLSFDIKFLSEESQKRAKELAQ